jgi:Ca-activated chloride channel family protein
MQQALEKQGKQDPASAAAQARARKETPAERERRLANEAWLRRVPDDPGSLLRAKFRLEYERRQLEGGE